jgi:hypothetical protein
MIENLLKLINSIDYFNESEEIEIAKGRYKMPTTVKEAYNQFKRDIRWQK